MNIGFRFQFYQYFAFVGCILAAFLSTPLTSSCISMGYTGPNDSSVPRVFEHYACSAETPGVVKNQLPSTPDGQ